MKPKLISFKLCPFVQKAVLTLLCKGIDYDIDYIDLQNPPAWFKQVSPLGKVPILQVGEQNLFESSVIVEYLNEVYGESLHPVDPLSRAQNRSWMEFGNECLMNGFNLIMQPDRAGFDEQRSALIDKLSQLEQQLGDGPFFNGETLSLVDLSYAPLFQRLGFINDVSPGIIDSQAQPKVYRWAERLLSLDFFQASTVPEIKQLYTGMMKQRNGYLSTLMSD